MSFDPWERDPEDEAREWAESRDHDARVDAIREEKAWADE